MIRERILECEDMEAVKAVLRDIRSSYGSEVSVSADDPDDLRLISVISTDTPDELCKGCRTPAQAADRLLAPAVVNEAMSGFLKVVAQAAATDLGTHIPKAPDPMVGTEAFFEAAPARPGMLPFLTGDFENAARRVGGSGGDAKRAKATRLLRTRIRYGNRSASFGEVVAESKPFRDLLVQSGWPSDVVEKVRAGVEDKLSGPGRIQRVDPATKVILFPMPDGNYRQVSPITSVALWHGLRTRIIEDRRKEGLERRTYAMRRRSVGGTKAQNVAVEASDCGGRMELLVSMPPSFKPILPLDRILHRVKTTGSAFTGRTPDRDTIEAIKRLTIKSHVDVNIRSGRGTALSIAAEAWLEGPITLSRSIDAGMQFDASLIRDGVERALVTQGIEALDKGARVALAEKFGSFVAGLDDQGGVLSLYEGDAMLDALDRAIEEALLPSADEVAPDEAATDDEPDDQEDGEAAEEQAPLARQAPGAAPRGPARGRPQAKRDVKRRGH